MTSENNCIIEDVDNACVEIPSDEIGVKEHDNFCDEPYDDSFDHNCGDAHIENVVGNVDCVVDNVHANLLENVGDINAKCDDDICDNSSNACKNATYDLHDIVLKYRNDFGVTNEVNCFNPYDFNDSDSFDSDDDDKNCFDTCENNSFVSLDDNDVLESFTFDDESVSNELTNDLHEICGDDDVNIEASLCDLNDIECVTFHDNCLDDALYIHDLIGKDRSEGVENENVKEGVEDKKKTRNESVREQVDEKVRNDEKDSGIIFVANPMTDNSSPSRHLLDKATNWPHSQRKATILVAYCWCWKPSMEMASSWLSSMEKANNSPSLWKATSWSPPMEKANSSPSPLKEISRLSPKKATSWSPSLVDGDRRRSLDFIDSI
nr:hypothetical protein Itr_chr04CG15760 [Ipomoea trifida]